MKLKCVVLLFSALMLSLSVWSDATKPNNTNIERSLANLVEEYSGHSGMVAIYPSKLNAYGIETPNLNVAAMTLDELKLLLSLYQYAAVKVNDKLFISSINKLKQLTDTTNLTGSKSAGKFDLVTETLVLEHIDPAAIMPVLRQLLPQTAHLGQSGNMMLISGFKVNVDYIRELAAALDTAKNARAYEKRFHK